MQLVPLQRGVHGQPAGGVADPLPPRGAVPGVRRRPEADAVPRVPRGHSQQRTSLRVTPAKLCLVEALS